MDNISLIKFKSSVVFLYICKLLSVFKLLDQLKHLMCNRVRFKTVGFFLFFSTVNKPWFMVC